MTATRSALRVPARRPVGGAGRAVALGVRPAAATSLERVAWTQAGASRRPFGQPHLAGDDERLHRERVLVQGNGAPATAQGTIKIGELNSYKVLPGFPEPYKKGMELALEEINAAGGVLGPQAGDGVAATTAAPRATRCASRRSCSRARRSHVLIGHLPLQRRPRGRRLRQAEQGAVPRRRAAHRQDRVGERQPLHLPAAALDLHADGDAGARGGEAEEEALGDRLPELRVRPVGRPPRSRS